MKLAHTLCALCLCSVAYAQIQVNFSTFTGYESNINRAPRSLETENDFLEKEDLYSNSIYQDVIFSLSYLKDWKKSSFTAYVTPEIRYYFLETDANQTMLNTRLTYKYHLQKKLRWDTSLQYKLKDREGQNLDQNELNLPFGYQLMSGYTGIRYRLSKQNRSFTKLIAGNKRFDNSNRRSIQYNYYGVETTFKNVRWKNHLLHAYGWELGYTHRDYRITNFSDNSNGDRTWIYWDAAVFYRYPLSKHTYVEPRLSYQQRNDPTSNRFGYRQLRPEILLKHKSDRWLASINLNYSARKFKSLTADDEEGNLVGNLKYDYTRVRSNIAYKIRDKWSLLFEASILDRRSNNEDESTNAFRSYANNYAGIGIRYQF